MLDRSFIRQSAAAAGFDLCGVAPCRHLVRNEQFFRRWLGDGRHASLGYLERNLDKRFDVRRLVEGAQTVVVCAVGYKNGLSDGYPDDFRAKIASYALTADYHATIKGMLGDLFGRLRAAEPALAGRAFVDSAPLVEKQLAVEAGLGWIGRQSLLVTPRFGSFVLLGELVLDAACDRYDEPLAAVAEESGMSPNSFQITNISAAPAAAASKPARQVPFATTARSMRAAASPVIRSNGRRLRKLPSMGGFSAATPARAAAPTTSVRRCIFIRRSIRCSIPCRSRPNGGSRWRRRNSARRSAARRSCAAASGASKPMRRKTCAEREGNDCRRCIKKNCSVVEQFFFRYSENPYFLCRFR